MKLKLSTGEVLEDLNEERIVHALSTLPRGDCSFAILEEGESLYMQTGRSEHGFVLEYQDGSQDRHYRCVNDDLELSAIQRAFQLYFKGDERWRTEYQWEHLDLSNLKKRWWQFWR